MTGFDNEEVRTYVTKPTRIQAFRLDEDNAEEVANWCGGQVVELTYIPGEGQGVEIPTLEGTMTAIPGDFVIRGTRGEFYPCKPEPFNDKYKEA